MSEFDFPKNWTIILSNWTLSDGRKVINLKNMRRFEVMQYLTEHNIVSYKLESE